MSKLVEAKGPYGIEKLHQKEAFEYYYTLGENRTLDKVADHVGKKARTIYEWSRKFAWRDRIEQRDLAVGKRLEEKTIRQVADEKANYRKLIKASMNKVMKDILKDGYNSRGIVDLERLIKLDLMLMGEATEITKVENNVGMTEQDRELVKEFSSSIKAKLNADLEDED